MACIKFTCSYNFLCCVLPVYDKTQQLILYWCDERAYRQWVPNDVKRGFIIWKSREEREKEKG